MSKTKDQMVAFRHAAYEVDELLTPGEDVRLRGDWWQILLAARGAARVAEQLAAYQHVQPERIEAAVYWLTYFVSRNAKGYYGARAVNLRDAIMPVLMAHLPTEHTDVVTHLVRIALRDASLGSATHRKVHYGPDPCRKSRKMAYTNDAELVTCQTCKLRMEAQKEKS